MQAREPLVKKLDDDLWELREERGTNTYRIVYCFHTGRCSSRSRLDMALNPHRDRHGNARHSCSDYYVR